MTDKYDYIDMTPEQVEAKLSEEVRRKHYDGLAQGAQSVCEKGLLDPIAVAENFLKEIQTMNTDKFMTFDEYVADLESNHRWQKDAFEYRRKATEIVHEHGGPEFRDFSLSEHNHDECVPCRDMPKAPELQQLAQHSRVTVVTREQSHYFDGYVHRSMVIFDVSEKNVEGYLYGHSQLRLERVVVNKDQIIECLPALRVGESDSCDVAGDIPF